MQSALHITTKVLSGNKIEVEIPEAQIGDNVDVFVVLPEKVETKKRSAVDILNELPGRQLFKTAEEVDKYLKEERESW
ncbi:hypothetical protein DSM106972_005530 [Dulcicalothrix desertica PCC 7102]|uniref:Uncharacterized protein n=1 Tax=Dulcicalothrix desertica PCC 7102 TaxID=232991 RepID=A0A433VVG6_9CYAN|nr:hypothetical protein [Dulcicalothrix desertica]RUT10058.1 hypothetical protein DSM106972_005530 [Dulcicalothrix desertica PCC 7102]TWH40964.1 hypothetical protein CAL7102_10328 [Dulcicalothrix desertica PCC 7102]